jgi:hypothetical protein
MDEAWVYRGLLNELKSLVDGNELKIMTIM